MSHYDDPIIGGPWARTDWKVIGKSNFDDESVSDILVREFLTESEAEKLADEMNDQSDEYGRYFYKIVSQSYKLYRFEP